MSRVLDFITSALFPKRCPCCRELMEPGSFVCLNCAGKIQPSQGKICHKCGRPVEDHSGECEAILAPVIAAYYYTGEVRNAIIAFKNRPNKEGFEVFSQALFSAIDREYSTVKFDLVVPVPAYHPMGKTTSGIIAEETAKKYFLPSGGDFLVKYRKTAKQHLLSREERLVNLIDSVRVKNNRRSKIKGKTVLLTDDIKTTGSTLNQSIAALLEAGAEKVYCACIAVSEYDPNGVF